MKAIRTWLAFRGEGRGLSLLAVAPGWSCRPRSAVSADDPARRRSYIGVGTYEGQDVVSIFGWSPTADRARWGPLCHALWDRTIAEARERGSTTLDLDEWDAAHEADRGTEPGTEREHPR